MKYLRLFSCCKVVVGYSRSIIIDLQRLKYDFIPNALSSILEECKIMPMDELKAQYTKEERVHIEEYFTFLLNEEYGFVTSNPEEFPEISSEFDMPNIISNASISIDHDNISNLPLLFEILDKLGCIALELRINCSLNLIEIFKKIELRKTRLQHINIILRSKDNLLNSSLEDLLDIPQIKSIYIYNASVHKKVFNKFKTKVVYYIISENTQSCGKIRPENFIPSIKVFNESVNFNSCLNKKISFDLNGNVKNCNFSNTIHGNIFKTDISEIIEKKEFKEYWNITKDDIDICKDCEFRYICIDCRVFISKGNNLFSKPLNCKYNPYIAKWEDEKGYRMVEECGYYNSDNKFLLDRIKLDQLNAN